MNEIDYRIIDNTCVYGLEESVVSSGIPWLHISILR